MVTHDNRVLDIADRIIHLEDGRLAGFTDSVLANTQHMMGLVAMTHQKQDLRQVGDGLDEQGFRDLLEQLDDEAQRVIGATALANDAAFHSLLEQGLEAATRKLGQLFDAERASLFLLEPGRGTLLLRVSDDVDEEVRIPIGTGIAGAVAVGETRLPQACLDARDGIGERQGSVVSRSGWHGDSGAARADCTPSRLPPNPAKTLPHGVLWRSSSGFQGTRSSAGGTTCALGSG